MFNSAMYEVDEKYFGAPRALVISGGKPKFPVTAHYVSGMVVAEPTDPSLPKIDLLDLRYDSFDLETTLYTEGVQHWMILLDRKGKIPIKESDWQANRTVVAKDKNKNFLALKLISPLIKSFPNSFIVNVSSLSFSMSLVNSDISPPRTLKFSIE